MSRYEVASAWRVDAHHPAYGVAMEVADCRDKKTGQVYRDGAYRVTRDGKPYKQGKGGTVPWYGESAWMDAERAYQDLLVQLRYA